MSSEKKNELPSEEKAAGDANIVSQEEAMTAKIEHSKWQIEQAEGKEKTTREKIELEQECDANIMHLAVEIECLKSQIEESKRQEKTIKEALMEETKLEQERADAYSKSKQVEADTTQHKELMSKISKINEALSSIIAKKYNAKRKVLQAENNAYSIERELERLKREIPTMISLDELNKRIQLEDDEREERKHINVEMAIKNVEMLVKTAEDLVKTAEDLVKTAEDLEEKMNNIKTKKQKLKSLAEKRLSQFRGTNDEREALEKKLNLITLNEEKAKNAYIDVKVRRETLADMVRIMKTDLNKARNTVEEAARMEDKNLVYADVGTTLYVMKITCKSLAEEMKNMEEAVNRAHDEVEQDENTKDKAPEGASAETSKTSTLERLEREILSSLDELNKRIQLEDDERKERKHINVEMAIKNVEMLVKTAEDLVKTAEDLVKTAEDLEEKMNNIKTKKQELKSLAEKRLSQFRGTNDEREALEKKLNLITLNEEKAENAYIDVKVRHDTLASMVKIMKRDLNTARNTVEKAAGMEDKNLVYEEMKPILYVMKITCKSLAEGMKNMEEAVNRAHDEVEQDEQTKDKAPEGASAETSKTAKMDSETHAEAAHTQTKTEELKKQANVSQKDRRSLPEVEPEEMKEGIATKMAEIERLNAADEARRKMEAQEASERNQLEETAKAGLELAEKAKIQIKELEEQLEKTREETKLKEAKEAIEVREDAERTRRQQEEKEARNLLEIQAKTDAVEEEENEEQETNERRLLEGEAEKDKAKVTQAEEVRKAEDEEMSRQRKQEAKAVAAVKRKTAIAEELMVKRNKEARMRLMKATKEEGIDQGVPPGGTGSIGPPSREQDTYRNNSPMETTRFKETNKGKFMKAQQKIAELNANLEKEKAESAGKITKLREVIGKEKNANTEKTQEITALKQEIESLKANMQKAGQQELNEQKRTIREMQEKLRKLETEKQRADEKVLQTTTRVTQVESEAAKKTQEIAALRKEAELLKNQLQEKERGANQQATQLSEKEKQIRLIEEKLKALTEEKQNIDEKVRETTTRVMQVESEEAEKTQEITALKEKAESLRKQLQEKERGKNQHAIQLNEKEKQIREIEEKLKALTEEKQSIDARMTLITTQRTTKLAALENESQQIEALLNDAIKQLNGDNTEKGAINRLKEAREEARKKNEDAKEMATNSTSADIEQQRIINETNEEKKIVYNKQMKEGLSNEDAENLLTSIQQKVDKATLEATELRDKRQTTINDIETPKKAVVEQIIEMGIMAERISTIIGQLAVVIGQLEDQTLIRRLNSLKQEGEVALKQTVDELNAAKEATANEEMSLKDWLHAREIEYEDAITLLDRTKIGKLEHELIEANQRASELETNALQLNTDLERANTNLEAVQQLNKALNNALILMRYSWAVKGLIGKSIPQEQAEKIVLSRLNWYPTNYQELHMHAVKETERLNEIETNLTHLSQLNTSNKSAKSLSGGPDVQDVNARNELRIKLEAAIKDKDGHDYTFDRIKSEQDALAPHLKSEKEYQEWVIEQYAKLWRERGEAFTAPASLEPSATDLFSAYPTTSGPFDFNPSADTAFNPWHPDAVSSSSEKPVLADEPSTSVLILAEGTSEAISESNKGKRKLSDPTEEPIGPATLDSDKATHDTTVPHAFPIDTASMLSDSALSGSHPLPSTPLGTSEADTASPFADTSFMPGNPALSTSSPLHSTFPSDPAGPFSLSSTFSGASEAPPFSATSTAPATDPTPPMTSVAEPHSAGTTHGTDNPALSGSSSLLSSSSNIPDYKEMNEFIVEAATVAALEKALQRPSFTESALRAILFGLEIAYLGTPFLGLAANTPTTLDMFTRLGIPLAFGAVKGAVSKQTFENISWLAPLVFLATLQWDPTNIIAPVVGKTLPFALPTVMSLVPILLAGTTSIAAAIPLMLFVCNFMYKFGLWQQVMTPLNLIFDKFPALQRLITSIVTKGKKVLITTREKMPLELSRVIGIGTIIAIALKYLDSFTTVLMKMLQEKNMLIPMILGGGMMLLASQLGRLIKSGNTKKMENELEIHRKTLDNMRSKIFSRLHTRWAAEHPQLTQGARATHFWNRVTDQLSSRFSKTAKSPQCTLDTTPSPAAAMPPSPPSVMPSSSLTPSMSTTTDAPTYDYGTLSSYDIAKASSLSLASDFARKLLMHKLSENPQFITNEPEVAEFVKTIMNTFRETSKGNTQKEIDKLRFNLMKGLIVENSIPISPEGSQPLQNLRERVLKELFTEEVKFFQRPSGTVTTLAEGAGIAAGFAITRTPSLAAKIATATAGILTNWYGFFKDTLGMNAQPAYSIAQTSKNALEKFLGGFLPTVALLLSWRIVGAIIYKCAEKYSHSKNKQKDKKQFLTIIGNFFSVFDANDDNDKRSIGEIMPIVIATAQKLGIDKKEVFDVIKNKSKDVATLAEKVEIPNPNKLKDIVNKALRAVGRTIS